MLEFPQKFAVQHNKIIADHTSFKIGGHAEYFARISDLALFVELAQFCRSSHIRLIPLGSGTNVLFSDTAIQGLVCIIQFTEIRITPDHVIHAQAGARLSDAVRLAAENSLTGLEFAAGIPGTIGGAFYGNAGAYGKAIGDYLKKAHILTAEQGVKTVNREYFEFAYRHSKLKQTGDIVLKAELQLQPGDQNEIARCIDEIVKIRRAKLPSSKVRTAGSYFKNIKDNQGNATAAALYLDAVGSKETHVGDAAVFARHANIFINKGHASAKEMLELEKILKDRVYRKFHIMLEREVIFIE